jgi:hypothetical protein
MKNHSGLVELFHPEHEGLDIRVMPQPVIMRSKAVAGNAEGRFLAEKDFQMAGFF